jgi:tRNA(Ile)-lysidine synthase
MLTPEKISEILSELTLAKKFVLGFSGGVDSHVLLDLLRQVPKNISSFSLKVIHVNHGLSPFAKDWEKHCAKICRDLNVEFYAREIAVQGANNLEALARKLRYQVLAEFIDEKICLLTAHHADDQAETLLLQLLRGAGPKGLSAMPKVMSFAGGRLARPLLDFSRQEILSYAKEKKLKWIDDESNLNLKFDRNYLRQQIIPLLNKNWPGGINAINRSARNCARANQLLEEVAREDLIVVQGPQANTLSMVKLLGLGFNRRNNLIRFWLHNLGFKLPSEKKLLQIEKTFFASRPDAMPILNWGEFAIRRYQDFLYALIKEPNFNREMIFSWNLKKPLEIAGVGTIIAETKKDFSILVQISFREGGERIVFKDHSSSLKKKFQEWQIPPWKRERIPLIYSQGKIIAVPGYYLDHDLRDAVSFIFYPNV